MSNPEQMLRDALHVAFDLEEPEEPDEGEFVSRIQEVSFET